MVFEHFTTGMSQGPTETYLWGLLRHTCGEIFTLLRHTCGVLGVFTETYLWGLLRHTCGVVLVFAFLHGLAIFALVVFFNQYL